MDDSLLRERLQANCRQWKGYRLADAFLRPHWRSAEQPEHLCISMHRRFPGSIAGTYSLRNGFSEERRPALLTSVIESLFTTTPLNVCAVHLRAGDVLQQSCREHVDRYTSPRDVVHQTLATCGREGCVTVVTGSHYWSGIDATVAYTQSVIERLRDAGVEARVRSSSPDADFAFLLRAKTLIPSRGGWTDLLRLLRPMVQ